MPINDFINDLKLAKIITINNQLGKKYKKLLSENVHLIQQIITYTSFLTYDAPISSRIYCIIKHINHQPVCKTCGNELKMRTTGKVRWTFAAFCNGKCVSLDKHVRNKTKETNLKKYGFENVFEVQEFKEKSKETNLKKYGFENAAQSPEIKEKTKKSNLKKYGFEYTSTIPAVIEKRKQTNLERFGVTSPAECTEIQEKIKQTNLSRYNVACVFQNPIIKEKAKRTRLKKYGVEHALQCEKFKEKVRLTLLKRYGVEHALQCGKFKEKKNKTLFERHGVEHALQCEKFKEKVRLTLLKRYGVEYTMQYEKFIEKQKETSLSIYGVEYASQKHIAPESLDLLNDKKWLIEQHHEKQLTLSTISITLNVSSKTVANYIKKHKIEIKYFKFSAGEKEVLQYIESLLPETPIMTNDRNIIPPYELDIFLPEYNIAIEYNGEYWHRNTKIKDQLKIDMCESLGIKLITVWENQWLNNQQMVKNTLIRTLNL